MATYGRVEPFYEDVEIWDAYVERLDQYFVANDITENAKNVQSFSACVVQKHTTSFAICAHR